MFGRAALSHAGAVIEESVPENLWRRVEPPLPARAPQRYRNPGPVTGGRPAAPAGSCSYSRQDHPAGVAPCGGGDAPGGVTSWRQLRVWTEVGVWSAQHEALLTTYGLRAGRTWASWWVDAAHRPTWHRIRRRPEQGRGVVERTFSRLYRCKRFRVRRERWVDIRLGLMQLPCVLICYHKLPNSS